MHTGNSEFAFADFSDWFKCALFAVPIYIFGIFATVVRFLVMYANTHAPDNQPRADALILIVPTKQFHIMEEIATIIGADFAWAAPPLE